MKLPNLSPLIALGLCALLCGCGKQSDDAPSVPPSEGLEQSIDPYEKAATLSASEAPPAPPAAPADQEPPASRESEDLSLPDTQSTTQHPEGSLPQQTDTVFDSAPQIPPDIESPPQEQDRPAQAALRAQEEAASIPVPLNESADIEQELLRLINEERSQNGVEALGLEESMSLAAGIRAHEALQSLSHTRPNGTPYYTAFDEAGFSYAGKWHGENLALITASSEYNATEAANALFAQWKESPGHHQNMLGESFFQTGIGVYVSSEGSGVSIGAAQLFASL